MRGKVLVKIIVSYGAIVSIALAVGIVLSFTTHRVVKELSDDLNRNLVNVIKSVCDSEFKHYKSFLETLKVESTVQYFGRNVDAYVPEDYWNDYQLQKVMKEVYADMQRSNTECYNLFVWSGIPQKMITQTSVMNYEQYGRLVCDRREEWWNCLKQELPLTLWSNAIGLYSDEKDYIVLLEPIVGVGVEKGNAVLGAWIDAEVLEDKINTLGWSAGMDWMLIDSQGNIVRYPSQIRITSEEASELLVSGNNRISIENRQYLISTMRSAYYDMEYVLFTPESMVNASANKIRLISYVSLLVILFAGVVLTSHFIKMHYHPLKTLLEQLRRGREGEYIGSEYEFLKQSVSDILIEKQTLEKKNQCLMRDCALEKLLLGQVPRTVASESDTKIFEKFSQGRNLVLICCEKEDLRDENAKVITEDWQRRAVISNVFAKGLSECFEQETFIYDNKVVSIVNVPVSFAENDEILRREVEKLREFINTHFQLSFYTFAGGSYEGIEGVSQSWSEACSCMEFADDLEAMYIEYDELRDMTAYSYSYSFDIEQYIVHAIKRGDMDKAKSIVDGVLDKCFDKANNTIPEMRICMIYDVYGTLAKVAEEQGIHIDRVPQIKWISTKNGSRDLKEYFHEVIQEISEYAQKQKSNELAGQVLEHIRNHYMDSELNISQIAYHFHVKPAWISAMFKKETGKSILEVIRKTRIESAQKLLNEGLSVMEVSQKVGFQDTTTFIRVFKSLMGVTPGQLKNR